MPLLSALVASCLAPASMQSPPNGAIDFSRTAPRAVDSLFFDEPGDGRVWVRGADFKASFGAEGATFIPFLGSNVSRNYPTKFHLEEVTVAGESLALGAAVCERTRDLVALDRGAVTSRYAITLESIEQSFVFAELPAAGELVLRLGVESDLVPTRDGAGWRFDGPEGGFDYGAATVIDAAGHRLALTTEWVGDAFVFRVPADFVAAATLPIVVDPVLSTGVVADLAADERSADVAYDPSWGRYMVSVEYVFSATDSDVRLYEVNGDVPGTLGINGTWMDVTTNSWQRPRIACRNIGNAFMLVATVGTGASRYVGGRIRDVDVSVINPPFVVSGTLTDSFNPDVGGDGRTGAFSGDPGFVVVWEKAWIPGVDHDIYMRSYSREGQPLTQPTTVEAAIGQYLAEPVISKSAGPSAPYELLVAWERRVNSSRRDIQARRVSIVGATVAGTFDVSSTGFSRQPEVSAISTAFVSTHSEPAALVVYTFGGTPTSQSNIHAVLCTGSFAHPPTDVSQSEGWHPSRRRMTPAVSCDGDQWTIAYSEQWEQSTVDFNMYMTNANIVGNRVGLTERHRSLQFGDGTQYDPRMASKWAAGGPAATNDEDPSFAVWTDAHTSTDDGIHGAHVASTDLLACGRQYCWPAVNSTGRRGWLAAYGDSSTQNVKTLHASYMPPESLAFMLVSPTTGFTPNLGGGLGSLCLGTSSIGRYSNSAASTGMAGAYVLFIDPRQIPQPTSIVAAMSGETWHFQCWHRDHVNGTASSNLTNAVAIPFL